MWPKALVQLLELAPHVTRLVPVADRYLQQKAANRDASRRAMEQMAEGLRGDMGQVADAMRGDLRQLAAAQAGVYHQLNEQNEMLGKIAADLRTTSWRATRWRRGWRGSSADFTVVDRIFCGASCLLTLVTAGLVAVFAVVHIRPVRARFLDRRCPR